MKKTRKIIHIDEEKCTGCGLCIPNCPEGALQVIDGKARLISDLFCDGLGACVGTCPEGALTIEERPAEPYDESKVMENIVRAGANTIRAHLQHLKEHGAQKFYDEAVAYLKEHNIPLPEEKPALACGCPGTQVRRITPKGQSATDTIRPESQLTTWPIQLTLVPVFAPYFDNAHILLAADCTGFTSTAFHAEFLAGKVLLIACPKLDDAQFYLDKLTNIFRQNNILSVTCLHMEVPCCYGLVQIARQALKASGKNIPFKEITLGIDGNIKEEK